MTEQRKQISHAGNFVCQLKVLVFVWKGRSSVTFLCLFYLTSKLSALFRLKLVGTDGEPLKTLDFSINNSAGMEEDRSHIAASILKLNLKINSLITGEDYTVVKKSSGECVTPHMLGGWNRTPSPVTEPPPPLEQKILELATQIIELLSGEVPIRCQDLIIKEVPIEECEYSEEANDLCQEVLVEIPELLLSLDGSSPSNPPERCPSSPYSQDCPEDPERNVPLDPQVDEAEISDSDDSRRTSGLEIPISVSETELFTASP
ncbi:uncharacterized protein LOC142196225 [Leptodactylus fuscus]|uniref:uncharacterized protein LOC142196225 n=1 Tax=Leptodactylus fuscus TaxID=238119 RepID=UPI003F4E7B3D